VRRGSRRGRVRGDLRSHGNGATLHVCAVDFHHHRRGRSGREAVASGVIGTWSWREATLDPNLDRDQHVVGQVGGPTKSGAPPFILDDPTEEKERLNYCGIMRGVVHLLNTALISANDGLKQLNSVTDPCTI
jgi:hypothetical protein